MMSEALKNGKKVGKNRTVKKILNLFFWILSIEDDSKVISSMIQLKFSTFCFINTF